MKEKIELRNIESLANSLLYINLFVYLYSYSVFNTTASHSSSFMVLGSHTL
uniref:Uncharacterized protein n=1 Tax=Amphimedon queenslandica TaxID=400682 RepID=A0A1X7TVB0_AMPQE